MHISTDVRVCRGRKFTAYKSLIIALMLNCW